MKKKANRIEILKELISGGELSNQAETLRALKKEGVSITQATLSRDLRQLKVVKAVTGGGKYVYVLPGDEAYRRVSASRQTAAPFGATGFVSLSFSGNICVIKTRPGHAGSIAYNIDNTDIPQILGTIAGDDTIFIVLRDNADYDGLKEKLREVVPLHGRQN